MISVRQNKTPEPADTFRQGYYEQLLQRVAGNTCLGRKPHRIITRSQDTCSSRITYLGKTVCAVCGREF